MTRGPQVFEVFGWAALLIFVLGALVEGWGGEGALVLFWPLAGLCVLFGGLFWFACWLVDLFKPWRF